MSWPKGVKREKKATAPIKQPKQVQPVQAQEIAQMSEKTAPTTRPKRVPVGTKNLLTAPGRPGFVRRWVNDVDDRVERFKAAGYEPVTGDFQGGDPMCGDAQSVGSVVTKSVGAGMRAVLMEIPQEFYQEDQRAKQQQVKELEDSMEEQARRQLGGSAYGEGISISR